MVNENKNELVIGKDIKKVEEKDFIVKPDFSILSNRPMLKAIKEEEKNKNK
ncbi:UNVERIFIED_CONTAM: hypothetical protein ABIC26_002708 [Paenibacillus sp. PvR008]